MSRTLRRGILFGLVAELPGIAAVALAWPLLTAAGPLLAISGGFALLLLGSALGLALLALLDALTPAG